jgi:23S rRNA pseudouridine2605 synthase
MTDKTENKHGGRDHGRKFRPKRLKTALPRPQVEAPLPPPKDSERIAKVMARAGLASRREAEEWIAAGRVAVNGKTISSPALNVTPNDRISVDGKALPQRERTRLFLFHKPAGLVTTSADPEGRPTIFDALPKDLPRLVSVGRLDLNTEGLILLTNDGGLSRALELPATGWLRRYRVRAHGRVTQPQLDGLRKGIEVDGIQYGPIEATLEREQGANVWLTFAMREGKNREIRNVMRELGLQVNRLIRVSYGPFQLADLPTGEIEEVKTRTLREQLGERLAALSGADFSGPLVQREAAEEKPTLGRRHERRGRETLPPRSGGEGRPASRSDEGRGGGRARTEPDHTGRAHTERAHTRHPAPPTPPRHARGAGAAQRTAPDSRPGRQGQTRSHEQTRRQEQGRGQGPARSEGQASKGQPPKHRSHRPHRGRHSSGPRPSRPRG